MTGIASIFQQGAKARERSDRAGEGCVPPPPPPMHNARTENLCIQIHTRERRSPSSFSLRFIVSHVLYAYFLLFFYYFFFYSFILLFLFFYLFLLFLFYFLFLLFLFLFSFFNFLFFLFFNFFFILIFFFRDWWGLQRHHRKNVHATYPKLTRNLPDSFSTSRLFYLIGIGGGFKTSTQNFEIH